jgi:hypothetical protein
MKTWVELPRTASPAGREFMGTSPSRFRLVLVRLGHVAVP